MSKHSKANIKNIYPEKQDKTYVELDAVPRVQADGEVVPTRILIPDNKYAYGDTKSVAQMAEDLVGKHTGSNALASKAGEKARGQLESTNFAQRRREAAISRIRKKRPTAWYAEVRDNAGIIMGYRFLFSYVDPNGLQSVKERFVSIDEAMSVMG